MVFWVGRGGLKAGGLRLAVARAAAMMKNSLVNCVKVSRTVVRRRMDI